MSVKCGLIGLPNVGKSTIFNALIRRRVARSQNFPFCTISPNVGEAVINDSRLNRLAELAGSRNLIPASFQLVDIAGLVKGASKGQGLGNQFLAAVRGVDALVHVLRGFQEEDVVHVEDRIDPIADAELIETELMLADLAWLERKHDSLEKLARGRDKHAIASLRLAERFLDELDNMRPLRRLKLDENEARLIKQFDLLCIKPMIYVLNISDAAASDSTEMATSVEVFAKNARIDCLSLDGRLEEDLTDLDRQEAQEFVADLGHHELAVDRLAKTCFRLLDLITFFTVGPKEARAWEFTRGLDAQTAAGKIHGDIERGFIVAEIISYDDYVASGGEKIAQESGFMRQEGRNYVLADADVVHFRFNV